MAICLCRAENILFDGDCAWLVDWEAAFLNDRYIYLAIAASFVVRSEQEEKDCLESYFVKKPANTI